eukprot:760043-Hanusia_phi.AAC.1
MARASRGIASHRWLLVHRQQFTLFTLLSLLVDRLCVTSAPLLQLSHSRTGPAPRFLLALRGGGSPSRVQLGDSVEEISEHGNSTLVPAGTSSKGESTESSDFESDCFRDDEECRQFLSKMMGSEGVQSYLHERKKTLGLFPTGASLKDHSSEGAAEKRREQGQA